MKKILASALAVAVASLVLTGCGGEEKQIVRISHSQIDTHPDHLGAGVNQAGFGSVLSGFHR